MERWNGGRWKGGKVAGEMVETWKGGKVERYKGGKLEGDKYSYESMYVYTHLSI